MYMYLHVCNTLSFLIKIIQIKKKTHISILYGYFGDNLFQWRNVFKHPFSQKFSYLGWVLMIKQFNQIKEKMYNSDVYKMDSVYCVEICKAKASIYD
jgi:hypothetical protein